MSNSKLPSITTCPAPMTRAALIALRDAGRLSKDCDYVITDHVQGRLVAGTTIHLQAVDASTLSENVSVKTTYDNEAWVGSYNIDSGIVYYLADNLNNVVRGTTDVTNFDWGNPAYNRCQITGSTLTVTYGNTASIQYLHVEGATLDLTGYAGNIRKLRITDESIVNLAGSQLRFLNCTFLNISTVNLSNVTNTGTLQKWHLNSSLINFSNSNTIISTLLNVRAQNSSWNCTNVTTGSFVGSGLDISNSTLNFSNGIGTFTVANNSTIEAGAIINFSAGNLTVNRSAISSGSTLSVGGSNTTVLVSSSHIKSSVVTNNGAGVLQFINSDISGSVQINIAVGSNCASTIRNTRLSSAATITIAATAIGNTLTLNGCTLENSFAINLTGTRSLTTNNSRYNDSNLILSGSGAVTDTINNSTMDSGSTFTLANSGLVNTFDRMTFFGLGATFNLSGTSGSGTYSRMALLDGRYAESNIPTAKVINSVRMVNTGFLNLVAAPAGYSLTNSAIKDGGVLQVNKTAVGNTVYVDITRGTLNIQNIAGAVADIIIETGTVTITNGSINRMSKTMNSTLTINGGAQLNVHHLTNISKTTVTANTNRVDYLGVVSSVPIL